MCKNMGSHLAYIESRAENDFVNDLTGSDRGKLNPDSLRTYTLLLKNHICGFLLIHQRAQKDLIQEAYGSYRLPESP